MSRVCVVNFEMFCGIYAKRNFINEINNSEHTYFSVSLGRVAQSVGHLTRKLDVLGSMPGLATYFRFSFR